MKRIFTIFEKALVYVLIITMGVATLGVLVCEIVNIFVKVPTEVYAYFGILSITPLLLGCAYEGITRLIEKL